MDQLKHLLVQDLQDLLHAEMQLVQALPKMSKAAHHPKLKEAFQKHLRQTEGHVERLKSAFELVGEKAQPKACKGMKGLIGKARKRSMITRAKKISQPILLSLALPKRLSIMRFQGMEPLAV